MGYDEPIIKHMTDDDLYKLSMMQAIEKLFPEVDVVYKFNNRRKSNKFTPELLTELQKQIQMMAALKLSSAEAIHLFGMGFFSPSYIEYLRNYRYDPSEVQCELTPDGDLEITITGKWHRTVLWEVKLMAIISQLFFELRDTDWNYDGQIEKITAKAEFLALNDCVFSELGTRRRRSYKAQADVVEYLAKSPAAASGHFVGTSNVYLAMINNIKALGTIAHEMFMGISALKGLEHANRFTCEAWMSVYGGDLGTALTDTFGSDSFFRDFDKIQTRQWDGLRHDSGPPCPYTDKAVAHYQSMRIDPASKYIAYTNNLTDKACAIIRQHCSNRIMARFGIGTFLTNDFQKVSDPAEKSQALNMVIKLRSVNGKQVVKISDDLDKATGEKDAVRVARYVHLGIPLDAPMVTT